ncbi:hypothetical protein B0H16DRAFT_1525525 [Mycena metata]|uniref:Uncharacterized protein n=1 Tax=Mycena metata TaxID=1033252 RepID=A0AAD7JKG5_9AGAR|nr:hypothetical protein B0H16DRAFT_1525525 [Mycena metata]
MWRFVFLFAGESAVSSARSRRKTPSCVFWILRLLARVSWVRVSSSRCGLEGYPRHTCVRLFQWGRWWFRSKVRTMFFCVSSRYPLPRP